MSFLFANYDEAPLEYSQVMLEDFECTRPRYIVLQTDLMSVVEFQRRHIKELGESAVHGENFEIAWRRISGYVTEHYEPEARVGRETVWRRRGR